MKEAKWISVKKRLPKCGEFKPYRLGWIVVGGDGFLSFCNWHPMNWMNAGITHWLDGVPPIPRRKEKGK